jgi:hypothetical protein
MRLRGEGVNFKKIILVNRIVCFFLLFLALTSFGYREPNYCQMVDRITKNYLKEVAKPLNLKLSGYGGAMMGDIQSVTLRFLSYEILNVNEARMLYIKMMEEFLIRINQNDKIRPYLHDYPFEIKNIELVIGFDDANGHILGDGHVAHMFIARNNTLYYEAYNPETEKFYTLHKENYGEALKIAQNFNMDALKSD